MIVFLHFLKKISWPGSSSQTKNPFVLGRVGPSEYSGSVLPSLLTPSLRLKKKNRSYGLGVKKRLFVLACHFCKQKWQANYELQELLLESSRPGGWC